MAPSKVALFSLVVPIFMAAFLTRPPALEECARRFVATVQNVNLSVDVVWEKVGQIVGSSGFRFVAVYGLLAGLAYSALQLYRALTEPLAIYGDEAKIAYFVEGPEQGKTKEERVREFKRARRVGDVPPVYPNGWMAVLMSSELKKKEHKFVHVAGKNLAVFRGDSSRAFIVDAYCAHLGANLAVGGSVHGDCIECPFHGWRYRGEDGKCVKIGYAEKVPELAKIKAYNSCEVNQRIFLWYHAEGKDPEWQIPNIEEVTNGTMIPVGFTNIEYDGHTEDTSENGSDMAHLDYLHAPRGLTGRSEFSDADWAPDPVQKHVATISLKSQMGKILGIFKPPVDTLRINQIGPCLSHYEIDQGVIGRVVFIYTVTPVGPMRQRMITTAFCKGSRLAFFVGKRALYQQYHQVQADVVVWANKAYIRNALLVKEDHLIAKHRRFFTQFYSENSPKYERSVEW